MTFRLTCIDGDAVPQHADITTAIDLGRDPHCDVRLIDDRCSRFHARLTPEGGGIRLTDNQSSNGTHVGGKAVDSVLLRDGAIFRIGSVGFVIADTAASAGATRVVTDDGLPLDITGTGDTRVWKGGSDSDLLPGVHTAIQAALRCTPSQRPVILAAAAARLTGAKRAALVNGGRVSSPPDAGMSERLARRLAGGGRARLLHLGEDLAGRTIAAEAIGSAMSAPLGEDTHLVLARGLDDEGFNRRDLDCLALLAGEAAPWFAQPASASIGLVGSSEPMRHLRERIRRIAATETTVLITGESGTGKEHVAQAIHALSGRRDGPFVAVNCAAIAENLVEAELFGHERGAFTGATDTRIGRFRQADGGVLFLDEIGEMPLPLQAKLLRALQDGAVTPVGGEQPIAADVRIVAATNRDLQQEVDAGRFRADLYYRLDVIRIHTPALRDHLGDLTELAEHLLARAAEETGVPLPRLPKGFIDSLAARQWPGNVRQLRNTLTRVLVLSDGDLDPSLIDGGEPGQAPADDERFPTLADMEAEHVRAALDRTGWNKSAAARLLGISRPTLHKKIADYRLAP